MKLSKDEFRKLQKHWYKILSENGFEDIEEFKGDELILKEYKYVVPHWLRNAAFKIEDKEEYFRTLSQHANSPETIFDNEVHKHILVRYSEGIRISSIVEELFLKQVPRKRHAIRFIIRKYEMRWGIKSYDRRMLNRK